LQADPRSGAHARPGRARSQGDLQLHLYRRHHRHVRRDCPDQRRSDRRLPPRAALHNQLLQQRPDRDQRRDVVVYRQEPVMSKAQAVASSEGLPPPGGGPVEPHRLTRRPLALWDRIKFSLLLILLWFLLVWSAMADDPLVGFSDAMRIELRAASWVFVLLGLEVLRQIH